MKDLELNVCSLERNLENPYNFCRTEIYSGTPLESELRQKGRLYGDYFSWDYVIEDPQVEAFFDVINTVFQERNFCADGVQNRGMWVDYFYHIAAHFFPDQMTHTLRAQIKNFVKCINIDNYERMARIYDFIDSRSHEDQMELEQFITQEHADINAADKNFKQRSMELIHTIEVCVGKKAMRDLKKRKGGSIS
jgi:hypothetical protein